MVREFLKGLPRKKYVTEKYISEKFCLKRPTSYFLLRDLAIEFKMKSELTEEMRDNGRNYKVRAYYKP